MHINLHISLTALSVRGSTANPRYPSKDPLPSVNVEPFVLDESHDQIELRELDAIGSILMWQLTRLELPRTTSVVPVADPFGWDFCSETRSVGWSYVTVFGDGHSGNAIDFLERYSRR